MSVSRRRPHFARTSASICSPFSRPGPRNDEREVRLALSNEALKMMSVPSARLMATRRSATASSSSADSITQGPAMNLVSIGTNITQKAESGKFIHPAPHVILPAACCRAASDPPAKQEAPQQPRRGGRRQKDRSDGPADKATRRHPPSPAQFGPVRFGSVRSNSVQSRPVRAQKKASPLPYGEETPPICYKSGPCRGTNPVRKPHSEIDTPESSRRGTTATATSGQSGPGTPRRAPNLRACRCRWSPRR